MVSTGSTTGSGSTKDRVVIIGGGPGGYEAALVAAQLGAEVTVVDTDGLGGSAVVTDCVPSKTLIATAELMTDLAGATELGVYFGEDGRARVDLARVNARVKRARARPVRRHRPSAGPRGRAGRLRAAAASTGRTGSWSATRTDAEQTLEADAVLIATGAAPRVLPTRAARRRADPHLGAGLRPRRGADEAGRGRLRGHRRGVRQRLHRLGIEVTLVSSRDRVLPGEDADAAEVLEDVLTRRGMKVLSKSRMESVTRDGDEVTVTLTDGRTVAGLALPARAGLGAQHRRPRPRGGRRRRSTRAASSRSTGSRVRRPAGCTPPATAPAC